MRLQTISIAGWLLLSGTAFSTNAAAQAADGETAKTVAMCAGIASDLRRLSCFDDLSRQVSAATEKQGTAQKDQSATNQVGPNQQIAVAPAVPQQSTPTLPAATTPAADAGNVGGWMRNDETDGLDKSTIVIFSLAADSGNVGLIGKPGLKRPPMLVLRCKEHQAQIFVSFDLAVTGADSEVPVQYRIGDTAPIKGVWSRSEDETSFGEWTTKSSSTLISKLETAPDLFVRGAGSNGRTSEALFKLDGIQAAVKPVQEACPW
jgi:type VI secretion system protein VasI